MTCYLEKSSTLSQRNRGDRRLHFAASSADDAYGLGLQAARHRRPRPACHSHLRLDLLLALKVHC